jgi:hypothetical protein
LKQLYEAMARQKNNQRAPPSERVPEKGLDGTESVTFHTTVQNKSQTSHLSTPEPTAPWSPIHMEDEYQEIHDFEPQEGGALEDRNHSPHHPNHDTKSVGSLSTFDLHDIDSNINYFPHDQPMTMHPESSTSSPPPQSSSGHQGGPRALEVSRAELDLAFQDISKDDSAASAVSNGMRAALEYLSQSQIKFIHKLQASLAVLQIPVTAVSAPVVPPGGASSGGKPKGTKNELNLLKTYPLEESLEKVVHAIISPLS